jgi:putative restriction endonuclease
MNLLQRTALRKSAIEAGFDVLEDVPDALLCRSSHAPLVCAAWPSQAGDFFVAFSMPNVVEALRDALEPVDTESLPPEAPPMAAVFSLPDATALEQFLNKAWALSRALPNALVDRFEQAVVAISATEREATVRQRVGQNLFREGLMALWGGRCAITGLDVPELLRASHAKPWADSNDVERMDVYNGLLLAAHWDAAFDAGLVAVSPDGTVLASPSLTAAARVVLGPSGTVKLKLRPEQEPYLAWHRNQVFRA